MFWYLLFSHLLADYPLQSNWIAANKSNFRILFLHILIHFLVGFILAGLLDFGAWPFVLALALIHLFIDLGKNALNKIRPEWVIIPYAIDQILHLVSIVGISFAIDSVKGIPPFSPKPTWIILATVYLIITYVWYISERILYYRDPSFRENVIHLAWPRMIARVIMLSAMLFLSRLIMPGAVGGLASLLYPYNSQLGGVRAIVTDFLVCLGGLVLAVILL